MTNYRNAPIAFWMYCAATLVALATGSGCGSHSSHLSHLLLSIRATPEYLAQLDALVQECGSPCVRRVEDELKTQHAIMEKAVLLIVLMHHDTNRYLLQAVDQLHSSSDARQLSQNALRGCLDTESRRLLEGVVMKASGTKLVFSIRLLQLICDDPHIVAIARARLRDVKSAKSQIALIDLLADASYCNNDPSVAEDLRPFLTNEAAMVRLIAMNALALVPGSTAQALIVQAIESNTDAFPEGFGDRILERRKAAQAIPVSDRVPNGRQRR